MREIIEQKIWKKIFPNEEFNADDLFDWISENGSKAFYILFEIVKENERNN